eukprot:6077145-Alexandrium_andersonii.AAC.1
MARRRMQVQYWFTVTERRRVPALRYHESARMQCVPPLSREWHLSHGARRARRGGSLKWQSD